MMNQKFRIRTILAVLISCLSVCILGTGCGAEPETESIPEETVPIIQTTAESEMTTTPETTTETATTSTTTTTTTELPETTTEITTTTTIPETDPPTEAPTEASTIPPTDPPTEPPTDPPTDPPTEPPTIPPTDPPVIAEQPAAQPLHFVLNTDTNCVHLNPGCRAAEKILPENYAEIDIWEEELPNYAYVYWACGICTKSYSDQLPKF